MRVRRAVAALAPLAFIACNAVLGISEGSPKPPPEDAAPPVDAIAEPEAGLAPDRCTTDADCIGPNACYKGRCDTVLGACTYALCETPGKACSAGKCDPATLTCGGDRDYGFRATTYKIGAALGCKASPQACVAAAFPLLFVGTTDGTIALRVDDMLATGPQRVPLAGIGFRPAAIVASGRRVWVLGDVLGTGGAPPFQLPIAWVDVPSDPTVATLTANATTLSYPYLSYAVFPAPSAAIFLTLQDAAQGFPAALLAPPLPAMPTVGVVNAPDAGPAPLASVPMYRLASAPAGSAVVASSGSRLVLDRPVAQVVNLVVDAGTAKVALGGDLAITPPTPPQLAAIRFAQGQDGSVFFDVPIVADPPPPSTDCSCYTHQRHQWVLPNGQASATDVSIVADFEAWGTPMLVGGVCHQCNPDYVRLPSMSAWIDAKTSLTVSPASENRALAATRVVSRDPLAAPAKRRLVTTAMDMPAGNFATDHLVVTGSGGLGYEVLSDSEGNELTLSIFDPRCDVN